MAARTLRLATRASRLALAQTQLVADALERDQGIAVEMVAMSTRADRDPRPLHQVGQRGMFAVELEQALRDGAVDAAVHSCKDLALVPAPDLAVAAWLPRADARDCIVGVPALAALRGGARIGTSSARRTAALRALGFEAVPIRGNVETRIRRAADADLDGCMLAEAGLQRLGLEVERAVLDVDLVVPEPAQGVVVVQTTADGADDPIWRSLDDADARWCAQVERAVALLLDGGCELPVGVHAVRGADAARVRWFVAPPGRDPEVGEQEVGGRLEPAAAVDALRPRLPLSAGRSS